MKNTFLILIFLLGFPVIAQTNTNIISSSLQTTNLPSTGRPRTLAEAYARKGILPKERPLPELKTPLERGIESRGFAFDCWGGSAEYYSFRQRDYLFGDKSKPIDWGVTIYQDRFSELMPYRGFYSRYYPYHRFR